MKIKGVYDFTVSGIDGNGFQYFTGMLEPERLDSHGLRIGKAFSVDLYHKQQKSELCTFSWIGGVPHNYKVIATFKGEILTESEIPALLERFNLLNQPKP